MKRVRLITFALCVIAVALFGTVGAAHAQTRVDLAPQQIASSSDGWTGYFDAGTWGWGFCLSHQDLQTVGNAISQGSNITNVLVAMAAFGVSGPELAAVAAEVPADYQLLAWTDMNGRGACVAFLYNMTNWPTGWAQ